MTSYKLISSTGLEISLPDNGIPITFGRSPKCNYTFNDSTVSGIHFTLINEKSDGVYFWDNKSKNGTYRLYKDPASEETITEQITKKTQLFPGQSIIIGRMIEFELQTLPKKEA